MTYFVEQMSDDYLHEIADYFASLDLPYAPPQTVGAPADEIARGEALVRQGDAAHGIPGCVQCHGAAMTGVHLCLLIRLFSFLLMVVSGQ